jgi:tetratricopeptide (TPR) repeat protein
MLQRTLDRLDQWARQQKPIANWKPDPMLATLPTALAELPAVKDLGKPQFALADGLALQEAIWFRDAANWAKGDDVDDLARSKDLFDWTVRNIQIEPDRGSSPESEHVLQAPWETLLLGRGTAWERAWIFILLARQQGIDAVVLGLPDANAPAPDKVKPWAVAVLSGGELYLFDPVLGLPIARPGGIQLNDQGQLDIAPATLSQLAADEKLLKQLDVDAKHPYPVSSADLQKAVALLEASPAYLQQKMAMIEARLVGAEKLVLTAAPSAQAERLKAAKQIQSVRLWTLPYEQLAQRRRLGDRADRWQQTVFLPFQAGQGPALWKGRVLHLKGIFTGDSNAVMYYQMARPSDRELADANLPRPMLDVYLRAKLAASYWLGLIAQAQGNYRSAIDYLSNRTLLLALNNGPWTDGAHYNLARVYEAQHNYAKAVQTYRIETRTPASHGNLLRARWLESLTLGKGHPPATAASEGKPDAEKPAQAMPALPTLPALPED